MKSGRNRVAYSRFSGRGATVRNKEEEVAIHLHYHGKELKAFCSQLLSNTQGLEKEEN